MTQSDKKGNALQQTTSPYLLQHADNPVDWFPWCEEAFAKAKAEDKPIFLSIGYSTCHWCHVMAHESFVNQEIADYLNRHFISIKVDKEERPDIDSVYMAVCQAITGQGGWPLTVIMTPEQKPFFAGTYFPPRSRGPMPGLTELLENVVREWKQNRDSLYRAGQELTNFVQKHQKDVEVNGEPVQELLAKAKDQLRLTFDKTYGGFGDAPKFPVPHHLLFLLRYGCLEKDKEAIAIVEKTLQQLYKGGIYDHIGYGFCRYSTDKKWLAPHFEKMLYDNAMLTIAYLETYQVTGKDIYKKVAQKIMAYVLRELTMEGETEAAGFYSAQDADSQGEEGKFYLFTPEEVHEVLGEKEGKEFCNYFDITSKGNFEGANIPNLINNKKFTEKNGWQIPPQITAAVPKLLEYRQNRHHLHKDDKILTAWNAMMITAFAKAHQVLHDGAYLQKAKAAAAFLDQNLKDENGRLCTSYRLNQRSGPGYLDDYAYYCWAMLELYQATFEPSYLQEAVVYTKTMIQQFFHDDAGGFYLYANDSEALLFRPKEHFDSAVPSGNAVAAYVLQKLTQLTADPEILQAAAAQNSYLLKNSTPYPLGHTFSMLAFMQENNPRQEIICCAVNQEDASAVQEYYQEKFLPQAGLILLTPDNKQGHEELMPYLKDYKPQNGKTTFYVCQNNSCGQPFHQLEELDRLLQA